MIPLVVIIALIAAPVLLSFLLRVQPSLLFMSILAGYTLAQFLSDDTSLAINVFAPHVKGAQFIQMGLLIVPVVLTIILARKSANQKLLVFQPIILIACGLLFAALLLPLLPAGIHAKINTTRVGTNLDHAQHLVVGVAIALNLVFIWFTSRIHHEQGHSKKHR